MRLLGGVLWVLALACGGAGEPDFSLVPPAEPVILVRGQIGTIEVEVVRAGGLETTVVVTAGGLRAGITPGALSLRPGQDGGTLSLAVEGSATLGPIEGAYLIGVSGELERIADVELDVVDSP